MSGRRKSIVPNEGVCLVCGNPSVEWHHIFFGQNRRICDQDNVVAPLCHEHHQGTNGVHGMNGHDLDMELKQFGEMAWIYAYTDGTIDEGIDDFRRRYGINYL